MKIVGKEMVYATQSICRKLFKAEDAREEDLGTTLKCQQRDCSKVEVVYIFDRHRCGTFGGRPGAESTTNGWLGGDDAIVGQNSDGEDGHGLEEERKGKQPPLARGWLVSRSNPGVQATETEGANAGRPDRGKRLDPLLIM